MNESVNTPADGAAGRCVGELSEGELLAMIFPRLPHADAELLGPGDDAAVVAAPDGRFVVTTDTMIHGPDFRLAWSTAHDLGWKAAASNLADVAAMGARPTALVVALAMPKQLPLAVLEGFADGLREACAELAPGCGVVGGDLAVSEVFMIAVTAFGDLEGREPVRRDGAREGDVVAVAGALGAAATGLRMLFDHGVDATAVPSVEAATILRREHPEPIAAQLAPRPPIMAGVLAADAGATSMLDLSDGLALDAGRVASASGVAIDLVSASLGPDPAVALSGGEDHSLLATFPPDIVLPTPFRAIGAVRAGSGVLVDGVAYDGRAGWDPYRDWDDAAG
ncbi:thiamine-phosphate kinase [Plantibacter flavus]|uniref:thiamine-phosphate kinase n=1 Tax=Plantibacter flavus TaxID=150123 RepID=UPI003F16519F